MADAAQLNAYLAVPYRNRGRDMSGLDCWGLVRLVAAEWFGLPWLPRFDDCDAADKQGLTLRHDEICKHFVPVAEGRPGDLVAGYLGPLCIHVGIGIEADGQLRILHTRHRKGPGLASERLFARDYQRIQWWRYGNA